ncbi:MAG: 5-carboxymethyl-2-hydroxymuconate Delta-isomerase [Arenicellales bacterium WSBS_2016_MAG_OTU3]
MPHIIIEYSENLEDSVSISNLLQTLHNVALATGVFPLGGLRTRAAKREDYVIADGHADNAFIHVLVRIGAGRDAQTKKQVCDVMFAKLTDFLAGAYAKKPLGISFELQEIDPDYSYKQNNIHEMLTKRSS